VSRSLADHRPAGPLAHGARGRRSLTIALAVALPLVAGCSDWRGYWDRSPTRPRARAEGVTIDFPASGHRVATRGTLILSGGAVDRVEGPIPASRFSWHSSLDGAIGTGPYLRVTNLSVGTHTITARAVNAWGATDSASIQVEVAARPTYRFCATVWTKVLRPRCAFCHYPGYRDWPIQQLDLRSYAGLMAGGITRTRESIVPCRPESSLVWNKMTASAPWVGTPMPPAPYPAVPAALREKIRIWILEGAPPDDPEICN
jgi:hypothetical protein